MFLFPYPERDEFSHVILSSPSQIRFSPPVFKIQMEAYEITLLSVCFCSIPNFFLYGVHVVSDESNLLVLPGTFCCVVIPSTSRFP
jgi:hypothetical protein